MAKKLTVEISARDDATKVIKSVNKELNALNRAYKVSQDTLKKEGDAYKTLQGVQNHYSKSNDLLKEKLKQQLVIAKELQKERRNETKSLKEAENSLKSYQEKYSKNKQYHKDNQKSIKELYQSRKQLVSSYKEETQKLNDLTTFQKSLKNENKELKKSLDTLKLAGRENGKEFQKQNEIYQNNKNVLKTVGNSIDEHKKKVSNLSTSLKENSTAHKELKSTINGRIDTEKELIKKVDTHSKAIDKNKESHNKLKNEMKLTRAELENCTISQKKANSEFKKDTIKKQIEGVKKYREQLLKTSEAYNKMGNALLKISAPGLLFAGFGIKEAITFESAFAGVRKTVDATDEQFEKLKKTITSMSERLPQSANEIAKVMEMAGQLGVGINDIEKFSETMIKLGDSTNLASDEAAKLLAQYTNITGMDKSNIDRLASTIVDLGNNTATTEADIVSMMHALAGMGANFKLTDHQIAGISATLTSVGIASEKGGTAMGKFMMKVLGAGGCTGEEFRKMGKEAGLTDKEIKKMAKESGQQLQNFSNIAGVSADKFKEIVKNNPSEALRLVVEGLGKMKESGQDITPVLDTLGIKEVRLRDTVLRLAGGHKELTKNLNLSKKAWQENTALETEAQKRYKTTESQLKMLKNQFSNVARELAVEFLPILLELMKSAKGFISGIRNMDGGLKKLIATLVVLTAGAGGLFKAVGLLQKFRAGLIGIKLALGGLGNMGGLTKLGTEALETAGGVNKMTGAVNLATKGMGLLNPATIGVTVALTAGIGAWKTYSDVVSRGNATILDAKDNLNLWDKWINLLTGTTKLSNKELEEQGYKFSETGHLSTEFAKKVQVARESSGKLNLELAKLSKQEFKINMYNGVVEQISHTCDEAIKVLQEKKKEIEGATREALSRDGILDEEEQKLLDWLNKDADTQIKHLEKLKEETQAIHRKAFDEKRKLTEEETQRLIEIEKEANKISLDNSAKTKEDLLYMQEKFINEFGKLDLDGQSKLLIEKKAQADKEIADIKALWDTKIKLAEEKLPELSGKEREEAEKNIELMKQKRDEELTNAQEHYQKLLEAIKEKYPEMANEIDEVSGKILSNREKNWQKELEGQRQSCADLQNVTKTGYYTIFDETTKTFKKMYVSIDETTGKIKGVIDQKTGHIVARTEEEKKALESLKKTHEYTNRQNLLNLEGFVSKSNGHFSELQGYIKRTGGTIEDLGKNADGTTTKLIKLGNEKVEVKVDGKGAITNLDEVKSRVAWINNNKNIGVTVGFSSYGYSGVMSNIRSVYSASGRPALSGDASGTNYLTGYASGTNHLPSFANGGHIRTRVNEMGWELFDLPKGTRGYMLGTNRGDDIMDLPTGTKITNHIASTRLMIDSIKKEVRKQMQPVYRGIENLSGRKDEKVIKQQVTVHFDNVVIRDDRDIRKIMQEMKYELNKEVI